MQLSWPHLITSSQIGHGSGTGVGTGAATGAGAATGYGTGAGTGTLPNNSTFSCRVGKNNTQYNLLSMKPYWNETISWENTICIALRTSTVTMHNVYRRRKLQSNF